MIRVAVVLLIAIVYLNGMVSSIRGSIYTNDELYYVNSSDEQIYIKNRYIYFMDNNRLKIEYGRRDKATKELIEDYIQITETIENEETFMGSIGKDEAKDKISRIYQYDNILDISIESTTILEEDDGNKTIVKYEVVKQLNIPDIYIYEYYSLVNYMLLDNNFDDQEAFVMFDGYDKPVLVDIEKVNINIKNLKGDDIYGDEYRVTVKKDPNDIFNEGDTIFRLEKNGKLPYLITFMDDKGVIDTFKLKYIINDNVRKYKTFKSEYQTILKKLDFYKEPVKSSFILKTKNSIKYLKVTYKMVGKRKNIISVELNGDGFIFNPNKYSNSEVIHKGYVINIKNNFLFQLKKVMKVDNEVVVKWKQNPRKSMLEVNYLNNNGYVDNKKFSRGEKQYYDIATLWYLATWMFENDKNEVKFSYIPEDYPYEGKIEKSGKKEYTFFIKNRKKYTFYLDNYGKIKIIKDILNSTELENTMYTTDTIEKNKIFLKEKFQEFGLVEVNDE